MSLLLPRRRLTDPVDVESPAPVASGRSDPDMRLFRRFDREVNKALCRYVHPWIPGLGSIYARQLERQLVLAEADIPLAGLPAAFDGTRLLLITDLHAGPFLSHRALTMALERLLAVQPDLILLGGDLATARLDDVTHERDNLRRLRAPLGVFAVFGNHDYYTRETGRLAAVLGECGIEVLDNRAVALERRGASLALAGLDDIRWGRPDLPRALREARALTPAGPVVLLCHHPDIFFEAVRQDVALVLSGHTHGGQIRLPDRQVLIRMSRFHLDEGLYRCGGSRLVVSRGFGVTGLPLRLGCPPEAVLLTLRQAAADSTGGPAQSPAAGPAAA